VRRVRDWPWSSFHRWVRAGQYSIDRAGKNDWDLPEDADEKEHRNTYVWNWELADAWVRHCSMQEQVLRMHGPISPPCSEWTKDDHRTPEELKQNLVEFMTALCRRYGGHRHVRWMDVVNETVLQDGRWLGPERGVHQWENPWTAIGYDDTHPLKPSCHLECLESQRW
jgi:hypothetical protein